MNNFRFITALCALLLCGVTVLAAYPKNLKVTTPDGNTVTVVALDDNIIKVINTPAGVSPRVGGSSVLGDTDNGECLNPDGKGMRTNICGIEISLTTDGKVSISAGPGKTVTDSGIRAKADGKTTISLTTQGSGSFYGTGERGHKLNLRGDTLTMYNRQNYGYTGNDPRISQMNITMPLFLSSDGYAIVFDDFAPAQLVLGNPVQYITESPEPVTWYYVNGTKNLADVTENLTRLTGRQELPPLWTLGYITSRYGYKNQTQTEEVVDSLKAAGYPLDGIVLDLYWYGKEQDMGRLEWDRDQWPDHVDMLDYLKKNRGVKTITITQPYILRNSRGFKTYRELAEKGLMVKDSANNAPQEVKIWVGEGGMFDVSNPETRTWLAQRLLKLTNEGVGGWWGDLGEPEVHPEQGMHYNGLTARQYHNKYGNDWSQIIYDLYKSAFPQTRLVSMMRGGTTGLQRYDVFPWSTDVSRSWGGLEPQVRIMLNSGLSGLGYMGHDVGGFAIDPANPIDPELYVRWLQLGLFSPMLRTHAQQFAEPYNYPDQQDILLPIIKNRYRWLPYNYTLAWENATKGYPLVRPLNFYSENPAENYDNISDEFLWGRDVLVAPVMTKGAVKRDIVLPAGSEWVDINHPTKYYAGGTTIKDYDAPLEVLPLFAREGAFIPMADYKMNNTGMYNRSKLTVQYYPSANVKTSFTMFEDDMSTPSALSKNMGREITFTGDATGKGVEIEIEAEGYFAAQDEQKSITLVVNNQKSEPRSVTLNGMNVRFTYDKKNARVTASFIWKTAKPAVILLNH